MAEEIGRLLTAMVTPFDSEGQVDYQQARKLARALVDSGSDGVVVAGTTGESPTLRTEEKIKLYTEIKAELGNRGTVVAGTGNYSTAESIELTEQAEKSGVDAVMAVVPYYNKPSQEGLYQHFRAIAESTKLPCILYNVPSRTITNLNANTTIRLSEIPNIVGVKEASGDFSQIAEILAGVKDDFLVWSGNDSDTFGLMSLGGYGVISVASHLVGKQISSMMREVLNGNLKKAAAEHQKLLPISRGLFVLSNPVPVKYCVNLAGFPVGKVRLPLVEADEATAVFLGELMSKYTLDLPLLVS